MCNVLYQYVTGEVGAVAPRLVKQQGASATVTHVCFKTGVLRTWHPASAAVTNGYNSTIK